MSSRIIRGDDRVRRSDIRSIAFEMDRNDARAHEQELRNLEQQSYEKGYREGERVGKQTGERMIETTAKHYEQAVAEMAHAFEELQRSMETQTVELALEIARKIIQREVSTDPDLVSALALVALKRIQSPQGITIRVSRYDFNRVHDAVTAVNGSISVVEDSSLERGDFMMDTGSTHLDGRVQSEVDTLGRAMLVE